MDALVMDAETGAVLATVRPPAGYSSFALFGLRFDPATRQVTLRKMPDLM